MLAADALADDALADDALADDALADDALADDELAFTAFTNTYTGGLPRSAVTVRTHPRAGVHPGPTTPAPAYLRCCPHRTTNCTARSSIAPAVRHPP